MAANGRLWLAAAFIGVGVSCARAQSDAPARGVPGSSAVRLPAPSAGVWRFRYELALWSAAPAGLAVADTSAPLARTTLLVDEHLGDEGILRRSVRGADVEVPALASFGAEGMAWVRRIARALGEGRQVLALDARNRPRPAPAVRPASVQPAAGPLAGSGDALLASVAPLGLLPPLPGRALAPGDTWTDTVVVRVPGSVLDEPVAVPATLRLAAVHAGGTAASAVVTIAARIRHAVLSDGSTVNLTLSSETVVDLATGVPVRAAADLLAAVRDARGAAVPVRARLTAQRLPLPARAGDVASGH